VNIVGNGNVTMRSVRTVELHVTANNIQILNAAQSVSMANLCCRNE
jgi:hypothetical protein